MAWRAEGLDVGLLSNMNVNEAKYIINEVKYIIATNVKSESTFRIFVILISVFWLKGCLMPCYLFI